MNFKIHIAGLAVLLLASCDGKPSDRYSVTGQISGVDGQPIYLTVMGDSIVVDSTIVEKSMFKFEGTISHPTHARLRMGERKKTNKAIKGLFVEPGIINVTGLEAGDFSKAIATGSKTNNERAALDSILDSYIPLFDMIHRDPTINEDSIRNSYYQAQIDFLTSHPDSYVSIDIIPYITPRMTLDEMKSIYAKLTPDIQIANKELESSIKILESIQPGMPAPELAGVNHKGETEKLSDLIDYVVLVDFWATWCGPCRASFPHLQEIYNKYHDKGFEVFCVADDDSNENGWKEYIESGKDGVDKYHHILRGLKRTENGGFDKSGDLSAKYAVHFLPSKFLVDRNGKLIGRVDDSKELDNKLKELFGE